MALVRAMFGADCVLLWPGSSERQVQEVAREQNAALGLVTAVEAGEQFGLLVAVDTADARRLQHVRAWAERGTPVAVVDHHPRTEHDVAAERVWRVPWGSCTTLVLALLCAGRTPRDPPLPPEALLAALAAAAAAGRAVCAPLVAAVALGGVLADSGGLAGPNAGRADALAAAVLHGCLAGGPPALLEMARRLGHGDGLSEAQRAAVAQLLESAERRRLFDGRTAAVAHAVSERPCPGFGEAVTTALERLPGCDALFAVGAFATLVVVAGRARGPGSPDCGAVLRLLGGGGHPGAAAATLHGETLASARERLYAAVATAGGGGPLLEAIAAERPVAVGAAQTVEAARAALVLRGVRQAPALDGEGRVAGLADRHVCDRAAHLGLGHAPVGDFLLDAPCVAAGAGVPLAAGPGLLGRSARLVCVVGPGGGLRAVVPRAAIAAALARQGVLPREAAPPARLPLEAALPRELLAVVREAGRLAEGMGAALVASGGLPRDLLLGRPVRDLDLMVAGVEARVFAAALHASLGSPAHPVLHHEAFHTAVVTVAGGLKIDVATARLEYYPEPAALPVVELASLKMDLARRDFSMNALAVHLTPGRFGQLEDHFNSKHDIEARRISVLHPLSFVEDPTRLFRALRFATRLGFHLCPMTTRLAAQAASLAERLTGSRIWHELAKGLEEDSPAAVVAAFLERGLLRAVHPALQSECRPADLECGAESVRWMREAGAFEGCAAARVLFVTLVWRLPEEALAQVGVRLMLPPALVQFAARCRAAAAAWQPRASPSHASRVLRALPPEGPAALRAVLRAAGGEWDAAAAQYATVWRHVRPLVTGHDLKQVSFLCWPVSSHALVPGCRVAVSLCCCRSDSSVHKKSWPDWCRDRALP